MLQKKTFHMQQCMFMFCLSLCFHHNIDSKKLQFYEDVHLPDTNHAVSQITKSATVFVISAIQTQVTLLKEKDAELYKF